MASIVGLSKISMPRLEKLDADSARELRNYLYQMQEQLEYILSNIDTENLSGDLQEKLKYPSQALTRQLSQGESHWRVGQV